jgi:hypothetical protein
MKIGNKNYSIKSSEVYLVIKPGVSENLSLTIFIWCELPNTYWIVEPIELKNIKNFSEKSFRSDFKIQEIINVDSTLLVENEEINVYSQKVVFDNSNLSMLRDVKINGESFDGLICSASTSTSFSGIELWKYENYASELKKIENTLDELSINYSTVDEIDNGLIRIKLINRA